MPRLKQGGRRFIERVSRPKPGSASNAGLVSDITWREHLARYQFAGQVLPPKGRFLDIAVGTGYGSEVLLNAGGFENRRRIVGVDISKQAIAEARDVKGLRLVRANAEKTPFKSHSFDGIVSFETIEHLKNPRAFLLEAKRLMKREGSFVVSTPVKELYSAFTGRPWNPFHTKEFRFFEFVDLLRKHFGSVELYGQSIPRRARDYLGLFGVQFMDQIGARGLVKAVLPERFKKAPAALPAIEPISRKGPRPLYLIAVCKDPKY
ncbi:class I SAM-dependent methyltransferase [Candidatus Micrarchaeota archaeon]|nr:class I SAM-dependent methyltransferase [Candidatus Micrarchaeota archaeon]MBU1930287.1 class I SAM-dependent methyltransferase [Candidatus Micrarchaeota archaeon]